MFCPVCRADYPADYKVCPKDATHLLASARIGKYQIDALIGIGGMGAVYRAINPDTRARVAIKLMNPTVAGSEPARARFQREAAAVAALRTTHVVKVYDFGTEADGTLYLVMELLDGHTLRDEILPAPTRMDLARVQMVMDGALKGLAAAHRAGIVHRDLKPDNVFVADTDDGEVPKLLDFGIARVTAADSDLTRTGSLMGTAAYMAVEQVSTRATEIGPWSDVYAMGTILYEMLAGTPAFAGATLTDVLHRVLQADVTPLATLRPGLPAAIYDLVERCTNLDAAKRPQDAEAMRVALTAAQLVPPGTAIPPPPKPIASRTELATAPTEARDVPADALAATSIAGPAATASLRAPDAYRDTVTAPAAAAEPARGAGAKHDATALMRPSRAAKDQLAATIDAATASTVPPTSKTAPPATVGAVATIRSSVPPAPSRSRTPLILGMLAIAAAAGVGVVLMLRTPPAPPNSATTPTTATTSNATPATVVSVAEPRTATVARPDAAPGSPTNTANTASTANTTSTANTATAATTDAGAAPSATAATTDAGAATSATAATATTDAGAATTDPGDATAASTTAPTDAATAPCDAEELRVAARAANRSRQFKQAIELAQQGLTCGGHEAGLHAAIVFAACKVNDDKLVMRHYYSVSRPRIEDARTICARQGAIP